MKSVSPPPPSVTRAGPGTSKKTKKKASQVADLQGFFVILVALQGFEPLTCGL